MDTIKESILVYWSVLFSVYLCFAFCILDICKYMVIDMLSLSLSTQHCNFFVNAVSLLRWNGISWEPLLARCLEKNGQVVYHINAKSMMASSNWNIFLVTGPLWGESTGHRWIPPKGHWRGALMFSLICAWTNGWASNRCTGDLRRHHAHYNVTVMLFLVGGCGHQPYTTRLVRRPAIYTATQS